MLEEGDLVDMGITCSSHRLAILTEASKCHPVVQTGSCLKLY